MGLTKKLSTALKPLNEKTRTFKKKSPIVPINSAKVENPSTNSKKPNDPWSKNETNYRPLLKKLKAPSKLKKLKFSDSPSKCLRTNKILSDESPRKKRKSTPPDETVSELLNPCKLLWILNLKPEPKPFDRRRSLKVTSTTWKFNSVMPIDRPLMPARTSKF